jgi:hypothetical protein
VHGFMPTDWRKASFCSASGCVIVRRREDGMVVIGDSKGSNSLQLAYTPAEFSAFIGGMKAGEFDDLGQETPTLGS